MHITRLQRCPAVVSSKALYYWRKHLRSRPTKGVGMGTLLLGSCCVVGLQRERTCGGWPSLPTTHVSWPQTIGRAFAHQLPHARSPGYTSCEITDGERCPTFGRRVSSCNQAFFLCRAEVYPLTGETHPLSVRSHVTLLGNTYLRGGNDLRLRESETQPRPCVWYPVTISWNIILGEAPRLHEGYRAPR